MSQITHSVYSVKIVKSYSKKQDLSWKCTAWKVVQKNFGPEKILVKKKLFWKKICGPKDFRSQKIFSKKIVGPIFFSSS